MKKYYVIRGEFANTYNLLYVERDADLAALPEKAERITRAEAIRLAVEERTRRAEDSPFAGYADDAIYPASDARRVDWANAHFYGYELRGVIYERVVD